jgi:thioredoxin 1
MSIIEITDDFDIESIYEKSNENIIIIDFFTDWCGPCKKIAPYYLKYSIDYPQIIFYKCNAESEIFQKEFKNDVEKYPTFLFIRDMSIIDRFIGSNEEKLKEKILSYL